VGELRAYALGISELRSLAGATNERRDEIRTLAEQAYADRVRPLAVRDLLGPIHRRVPGAPVLRTDDPTPADLDLLLTGGPVPPARAAATWRLVEAVVGRLAWSTTRVPEVDLPAGLLAGPGLPVPLVDGLRVGWCPLVQAAAVPGLRRWLAGSEVWVDEAARAGRAPPDVLAFAG